MIFPEPQAQAGNCLSTRSFCPLGGEQQQSDVIDHRL
jgi:hypothetical protein